MVGAPMTTGGVFNVPFDTGIRGDVDPAVAPDGFIARIENGRIPRAGGIVKRHGADEVDPAVSATSQAMGADRPHGAAEVLSREILALSGRVYARDWSTAPTWQEAGRVARYLPIKGHWLALNATTTVDTPPHVATMAGAVCVVYTQNATSGPVQILLYDEAMTCRFSAVVTGRRNPRVMTVGSDFVITYEDINASPTIVYLRTLTPSTLTLGAEQSFITRQTANDRYDAAPYSDTEILWSARTGSGTWTIQRLQISPLSIIATRDIAVANSVHAYERVYANGTDGIYAAFYVAGAGTGTVAALDDGLTTSATNPYGTNAGQHPGFTRRSATSVWLTWNDLSSGEDHLRIASVSTAAAVSTIASPLFALVQASTPFDGGENSLRLWIHTRTNVTGLAPFSDRYTLVTAQYSGSDWYLCPELTSDGRASLSHGAPTNGLKATGPLALIANRHFAPILSDIGVHTSAMLLEYEDLTTQAGAVRQVLTASGAGAIGGGHLQEFTFGRVNPDITSTDPRGFENGFIRDPAQQALIDQGAGAMSAGTFQVQVVYTYIDTAGRIHRSAPSLSQSITQIANRQIRVTALALVPTERHFSAQSQSTRLEIYMTAANGATFYRRANVTAAFSTSPFITVDFSTDPDTTAEILYTSGNRFANRPAPSSRQALVSHDAMWLAGLWDRRMIECSKLASVNQPARFTRADQFRAIAPFDVFAVAELDDQILWLGPDGLCVSSAQAPNDQGNPPLISPTVLSNTGCVAPNSIIRIPQGVVFFGRRGFYLVPRGGGEPEFIGAPTQHEIYFVFSAAEAFDVFGGVSGLRTPRSRSVVFACVTPGGSTVLAVLDQETLQWSSFDSLTGSVLGFWSSPALTSGGLVYLPESLGAGSPAARILSQSSAYADDLGFILEGSYIETLIETGWLRPFELLGAGYARRATLLCTVLAVGVDLILEFARDGGVYTTLPTQTTTATGLQAFEWQLPADQPCNSMRVRLHDEDTVASAGVVYHGISFDVDPVEGLARLPTTRRV